MNELQLTETLLLSVVAWTLIVFVVRDVVLTARGCLVHAPGGAAAVFGRQTSGSRLVALVSAAFKTSTRRGALLRRLNVLVPLLQIVIWKAGLIAGFAVLYLASGWQPPDETLADDRLNNFIASVKLSFAVSFRLAFYELAAAGSFLLLVANVQFYAGFLFFGFVGFYLVTLRQKARRLKPALYKLRYETDDLCYAPLVLADSLREYRTCNLRLILKDWEHWAERLRIDLRLHRQFIYGGIPPERNVGWLAALGVVLDASAALIVTSDGAVEKQARRTFAAARRALTEISELVVPQANGKKETSAGLSRRRENSDDDDEVLSAQTLFDDDGEASGSTGEDKMLEVWRATYEKDLRRLADALEAEIPSIRYDRQYC